MDKIEFEINAQEHSDSGLLSLRYSNYQYFCAVAKGDKLDRKLHVHDGDKFKVTIQKVKA
jgi:hypothetical protein